MVMSKAQSLQELLAEASELTIVCHNNPDPDCLASALALGRIAAAAGIDERHILYSGEISHQKNRAFVSLLDLDLRLFDSDAVQDRPAESLLAFVDHAVPGAKSSRRFPLGAWRAEWVSAAFNPTVMCFLIITTGSTISLLQSVSPLLHVEKIKQFREYGASTLVAGVSYGGFSMEAVSSRASSRRAGG